MFGIGVQELAIIAVLALLIFGPKRLPELARTVGKGLAEFRRASADLRRSIDFDSDSVATPPPARAPQIDPREDRDPVDRPAQAVDGALGSDDTLEEKAAENDEDSEDSEKSQADPPDSQG